MERYALHFLACRAVASMFDPAEWLTLKAVISMTTPLFMCACIFEHFPELSSIAPLERHVLGFCALQGGGLYISGTATLTNTNVYSNTASQVRARLSNLTRRFLPSPPFLHRARWIALSSPVSYFRVLLCTSPEPRTWDAPPLAALSPVQLLPSPARLPRLPPRRPRLPLPRRRPRRRPRLPRPLSRTSCPPTPSAQATSISLPTAAPLASTRRAACRRPSQRSIPRLRRASPSTPRRARATSARPAHRLRLSAA